MNLPVDLSKISNNNNNNNNNNSSSSSASPSPDLAENTGLLQHQQHRVISSEVMEDIKTSSPHHLEVVASTQDSLSSSPPPLHTISHHRHKVAVPRANYSIDAILGLPRHPTNPASTGGGGGGDGVIAAVATDSDTQEGGYTAARNRASHHQQQHTPPSSPPSILSRSPQSSPMNMMKERSVVDRPREDSPQNGKDNFR